ncbi:MAG: ATP phosphoribosyltransferase regulatory subunit [Gammaproteobacteria bacterium]|nr:ATP phosphoribosyltransferase regulatory subunit [Gammaproteobacteria bacterium]MDH5778942.1 ATP phosphoribosyltransferase regulatory subunit [Gammaproteobacteria bacterium]
MKESDRWLLPEGIEEVLPPQARQLEALRRQLVDLYACWGYDLVMPPFIEYIESLLTGTGHDLDLKTFKLTDQLTGRLMGVRADMTPQVARIDAHHLKTQAPSRLCYLGTVLHTRPDGFAASRTPLQVGAELYGHDGIESDVEILSLMIETLQQCGVQNLSIDLGHVGIYRGLIKQAGFNETQQTELFDALQRKSRPDMEALFASWKTPAKVGNDFLSLSELNGDISVLAEAKKLYKPADKSVVAAIDYLQNLATILSERGLDVPVHFDLAELRGYNYHTGVVFAAFVPGQGQAVAQGGRYDDIGQVFGQARPATGFSTDLKTLINLSGQASEKPPAIYAPADQDGDLQGKIAELRASGQRVICALPNQSGGAAEMGCDQQLVNKSGQWQLETI